MNQHGADIPRKAAHPFPLHRFQQKLMSTQTKFYQCWAPQKGRQSSSKRKGLIAQSQFHTSSYWGKTLHSLQIVFYMEGNLFVLGSLPQDQDPLYLSLRECVIMGQGGAELRSKSFFWGSEDFLEEKQGRMTYSYVDFLN